MSQCHMSVKHEHLLLENQLNMLNGSMVYFSRSYPPRFHTQSFFFLGRQVTETFKMPAQGCVLKKGAPPHGRKPNVERLKNGKLL